MGYPNGLLTSRWETDKAENLSHDRENRGCRELVAVQQVRGGKACTPKGEKGAIMSDLIKREDAIRELERSSVYMWSVEEDQLAHNWAISIIESLPSADAEWIPCSERLPEKRRSVLITTSEGFVGEACYWETTENHVIWKGYRWDATYWDDEVLAWTPLPKPCKVSTA